MKQTYFYLLGWLLAVGSAQAQDYRPFRAGLTYQFSESAAPGDTTHVLQLVAASRLGADSVFQFNQRTTARIRGNAWTCEQIVRPDNLFGSSQTVRADGAITLQAANGIALTLRPRAALNQSWVFMPGLTAAVSARTTGQVLGHLDSLATITLSDGASLQLSKTYGVVQSPALGHYLNARLPQRQLVISALPELQMGSALTGALAIFDFHPGDVFLRRADENGFLGTPVCQTTYERDSIVSRRTNPRRDTIWYEIRQRTVTNDCRGTTTAAPYMTFQLEVTAGSFRVGMLTQHWQQSPFNTGVAVGEVHTAVWRGSSYNGRYQQWHTNYMVCNRPAVPLATDSTGLYDANGLDMGSYVQTVVGLGETSMLMPNFITRRVTLVGYRKGSETWGILPTPSQLLPTLQARPATSSTASPNPFQDELTVRFELPHAQAVALTLRDALGRTVLTQPAVRQAAGAGSLALRTAGLSAGVYTLWLQPADGPAQVLKVLKN